MAGAYQYQVYAKAPSEKAYKKIATVTKLTYTNNGLKFNKSYLYKVRAVCKAGTVTTYGSYSRVRTVKALTATPLKVIAKKSGIRSLRVSWEKIHGAQGYQVYRMSKYSGGYDQIRFTKNNTFSNTQLTNGRTYYYKVRSWRMDGGKRIYGAFSKVIKVLVK